MGRRGVLALGLVMLTVLTGVAPAAPVRRPGMPPAVVADHCVVFGAGEVGSATSRDGTLTVTVSGWSVYRGFEWDGHGIAQALVPEGRVLTPWTGEVTEPIRLVVFCALLETGPVGRLV